jgi:hypothetical protein
MISTPSPRLVLQSLGRQNVNRLLLYADEESLGSEFSARAFLFLIST